MTIAKFYVKIEAWNFLIQEISYEKIKIMLFIFSSYDGLYGLWAD